MADELKQLAGRAVLVCAEAGSPLASEADAVDLIASLWGLEAEWVAAPVARLSEDFFELRSGVLGAVAQKFVTYGISLALVGDISERIAASDALRDFVRESNSGDHVWFVQDFAALEARLSAR